MPDPMDREIIAELLKSLRDGPERDKALGTLICVYARPEIAAVIRNYIGRGIRSQDCPDIQAAAEAGLTQRFLRGNVPDIDNFAGYVRTAARNAVCEHIRGPGYRRAVYHVCKVFRDHKEELSLWKSKMLRKRIGGYLEWEQQKRQPVPLADHRDCIESKLHKLDFTGGQLDRETCLKAVRAMLDCAGNPALLEELATVFGSFAGLTEPDRVSTSDIDLPSPEPELKAARALVSLLVERGPVLPQKERSLILLKCKLEDWVTKGIVTPGQLGKLLGVDPNRDRKLLTFLIRESPLTEAQIQEALKVTRPRQLLYRTLERLREWLKNPRERFEGPEGSV